MDTPRPHSAWWDLLAGFYVFATVMVAIISLLWASAPYENAPRGIVAGEVVLIAVAAATAVVAVAMARSLFRGNVSRAGVLLLASLAGLVTWWILLDAL